MCLHSWPPSRTKFFGHFFDRLGLSHKEHELQKPQSEIHNTQHVQSLTVLLPHACNKPTRKGLSLLPVNVFLFVFTSSLPDPHWLWNVVPLTNNDPPMPFWYRCYPRDATTTDTLWLGELLSFIIISTECRLLCEHRPATARQLLIDQAQVDGHPLRLLLLIPFPLGKHDEPLCIRPRFFHFDKPNTIIKRIKNNKRCWKGTNNKEVLWLFAVLLLPRQPRLGLILLILSYTSPCYLSCCCLATHNTSSFAYQVHNVVELTNQQPANSSLDSWWISVAPVMCLAE